MANQIAANLAAMGHDQAVAETQEHIAKFWDPRMKAGIAAADHAALSPIALAAITRLTASH
ncbi:formate dehydrogenase [Novosphingobium sp. FSY-8]|uniref:Formate dehydrogenase n=2 Tax=Novosphingobium ovatum TaxID=1908523 RepID=A0ABW9XF55_9SPHN|nr:formate dehydrogenase [Novosphingobium ovatum]